MNDAPELEYVGFWARVWACIIDTVLMLFIIVPVSLALFGRKEITSGFGYFGSPDMLGSSHFFESVNVLSGSSNFIISYVLPAVAVMAFWIARSATPGKMVIGATIVDAKTGGTPSVVQFIIRYVGYFVSTFPFCLGLIWVGFDKRKQGWHDKLAGTVVVRPKHRGTEAVRFDA